MPIQARAQASREAILRASAQLLSAGGYAAFTTNHAAAKAGVSIGTLYEYFRDKDALLDALLDRHLDESELVFSKTIAEVLPHVAEMPLVDVVRSLVDAMVAVHAESPKLHRVLSTEGARRPKAVARVRVLEQRIVDVLAQLFAMRRDVRVTDPKLAATVCVNTADALTHRWIVDEQGKGAERLAAELTTLLVRYLS